jgi:hypothetical protein
VEVFAIPPFGFLHYCSPRISRPSGTTLVKGDLRFGYVDSWSSPHRSCLIYVHYRSLVDFRGKTSLYASLLYAISSIPQTNAPNYSAWRHWGCVTPKIIENVKKSFEDAEDLDGFEELNEEDQQKLKTAWEAGHVAEEDVPPSAKKDDGEEEKPKKRATKKKKEVEDDGEGEEEEKPKKARGRKPKVSAFTVFLCDAYRPSFAGHRGW